MLTWVRQFLTAPVFEDEEKTRIAGVLNTTLLTTLPLSAMIGIMSLITTPDPVARLVFMGIFVLLGLSELFLVRRGYVQLASIFFARAMRVVITVGTLISGGAGTPGFGSYATAIVIAGLLSGGRAGVVTAGLCVLARMGML